MLRIRPSWGNRREYVQKTRVFAHLLREFDISLCNFIKDIIR